MNSSFLRSFRRRGARLLLIPGLLAISAARCDSGGSDGLAALALLGGAVAAASSANPSNPSDPGTSDGATPPTVTWTFVDGNASDSNLNFSSGVDAFDPAGVDLGGVFHIA